MNDLLTVEPLVVALGKLLSHHHSRTVMEHWYERVTLRDKRALHNASGVAAVADKHDERLLEASSGELCGAEVPAEINIKLVGLRNILIDYTRHPL